MLQIIVILLVAFIVTPLIDMITAERVRFGVKAAVYLIAFVWVVFTTFFTGKVV
jgi:hypothetical protein